LLIVFKLIFPADKFFNLQAEPVKISYKMQKLYQNTRNSCIEILKKSRMNLILFFIFF